jgi:hypothetical protein
MKMKRFSIIIILSAALFSLNACEKFLDLEPPQSLSEELALNSDNNVKNVLRGGYAAMRGNFLYGGGVLTLSELLAGDGEIQFVGTYTDLRQIFNKATEKSNGDVRRMWTDGYNLINRMNNVLSAIDVVNVTDQARVEGEALFLRSLMHFDLVRFFGQGYDAAVANNTQDGVPLILTPTRGINDDSFVSRSSVQAVYNKIIEDLERASTLLPEQTAATVLTATKGAADALLARIYLQKGDFTNARIKANAVIASAKYTLRPTYASVFNNDGKSTEDIFVTFFTTQDRFSAMTEFWSVPAYGGRDGDIDILDGHLNLYPAGDARRALFFSGNGAMRSGKWNNQYGVVNLIRLAEMHLIRAEANVRLGTPHLGPAPHVDINTLRQRAGLSGANLYESVTLNNVLLERRLELAHEGDKLHEVKRLKLNVGARPHNHPKLIFPIPEREMAVNPNLTQNLDY